MDTPTPAPDSAPIEPAHRSHRRTLAVGALAGAVGIAALGAGAVAAGGTDTAAAIRNDRTIAAIAQEMDRHLGDVTLDDLAAELADLGLEVHITPSGTDETGAAATGPEESAEGSDSTAGEITSESGGSAEGGEDNASNSTDPFAGMSDAEIDALSDDEFFSMLDAAGWAVDDDGWIVPADGFDDDWDDHDGWDDHDHEGDVDETAATFRVDGDRISATSGDAAAVAEGEAIWRRFVELIPADQRSMLVGFEVMAERGEGGYVYPDETDPTRWIMGISPGLGADEDFVLIHEFAHLLTLQAEEVPPSVDDGRCPTYHTGEGCSLRGSTMAEFVARFWPKAQRDEVFAAQDAGDWDAIDAFYAEHADDFVTDYATTNPAEDLAETFTVFVLNGRPAGDTIADQKVQFLWGDRDLVELRERIRAAL